MSNKLRSWKQDLLITKLQREYLDKGYITCPSCGNSLEADNAKCQCGWKNILVEEGYI